TGKKLDRLLGIPECKEDADGAQNEDTLRRFQDNFFKYNWGFSDVNDLNNFYGIPQYFNTCDCDECIPENLLNEIYISDKQILGSAIDAYRNFKSNQYLELPSESGDLLRIVNRGGRVLAHTSDGIWQLRYGSATIDTSEGAAILGQSDLLAEPIRLLEGIE